LVDTSVFLRLALEPERLSPILLRALDLAEQRLFSAASIWEIAIKVSLGKLVLPQPATAYVPLRMEQFALRTLPITREHALAVESLPFHHRDPFDRLLVAQALVDGLTVLTTDRVFTKYRVRTLGSR
jgi:PIN domain nuclease of toxin-antitoxin system